MGRAWSASGRGQLVFRGQVGQFGFLRGQVGGGGAGTVDLRMEGLGGGPWRVESLEGGRPRKVEEQHTSREKFVSWV